jgi:hypothetical protein
MKRYIREQFLPPVASQSREWVTKKQSGNEKWIQVASLEREEGVYVRRRKGGLPAISLNLTLKIRYILLLYWVAA